MLIYFKNKLMHVNNSHHDTGHEVERMYRNRKNWTVNIKKMLHQHRFYK